MTVRLPTFPAKQRDDFALVGTCNLPAGNWAARCQVRRPGGGAAWELAVTLGELQGAATPMAIEASRDMTAQWPPELLQSDVQFVDVDTGLTVHTSKFLIAVEDVVTR